MLNAICWLNGQMDAETTAETPPAQDEPGLGMPNSHSGLSERRGQGTGKQTDMAQRARDWELGGHGLALPNPGQVSTLAEGVVRLCHMNHQ